MQGSYTYPDDDHLIMSLADLPDDSLVSIFSCLSLPERLRLSEVCTGWARLSLNKDLWRSVDLSEISNLALSYKLYGNYQSSVNLAGVCALVRSIELKCGGAIVDLAASGLIDLIACAEKLGSDGKEINIRSFGFESTADILDVLVSVSKGPRLRTLCVETGGGLFRLSSLVTVLRVSSALTTLIIRNDRSIMPKRDYGPNSRGVCLFSSASDEPLFEAFCSLLKGSSLTTITLSSCGLFESAETAIQVLGALKDHPTIKSVELTDNGGEPTFVPAFKLHGKCSYSTAKRAIYENYLDGFRRRQSPSFIAIGRALAAIVATNSPVLHRLRVDWFYKVYNLAYCESAEADIQMRAALKANTRGLVMTGDYGPYEDEEW